MTFSFLFSLCTKLEALDATLDQSGALSILHHDRTTMSNLHTLTVAHRNTVVGWNPRGAAGRSDIRGAVVNSHFSGGLTGLRSLEVNIRCRLPREDS